MVTSFVAEKNNLTVWYYCLSHEQRKLVGSYFIYFPPGYSNNEIDLAFNYKDVLDEKIKAIQCHKTQIEDGKRIIKKMFTSKNFFEYFLVKKS